MTVRRTEDAEEMPSRGKCNRAFVGEGYSACCGPECCPLYKGARPRKGKGHGKHRTLRTHRKGR